MWTNYGASKVQDQTINWTSATIKFLLLTDAYTLNTKSAVDFLNDITAYEVSGVTGYARQTITGKTIELDNTNNLINFKTSATYNMTITGTITFKYLAVFVDTGTPSTSTVLAIKDKGANQSLTDDTLTITFSSGIVLQVANSQ